MSRLFRSEEMVNVMLIVREPNAHSVMYELGKRGVMQFVDLNWRQTAFQRRYVEKIKVCDELERTLHVFKTHMDRRGVALPDAPDTDTYLKLLDQEVAVEGANAYKLLMKLNTDLQAKEKELRQFSDQHEKLVMANLRRQELKYVLAQSLQYKHNMDALKEEQDHMEATEATLDPVARINDELRFNKLMGVVDVVDRMSFERMIFRFTRGKCFVQFFPIYHQTRSPMDEPQPVDFVYPDGKVHHKTVFVALFPGDQIGMRVRKICEAFGASIHDMSDEESQQSTVEAIEACEEEIRQTEDVKLGIERQLKGLLRTIGNSYYNWLIHVRSEKSIYHTMNKCDVTAGGYLNGKGWVLKSALNDLQQVVQRLAAEGGGSLQIQQSKQSPPTYFKTNFITNAFQAITDTYGVPRYREVNPTLFSLITFPFIFAVMFGDMGHGCLLFLASASLIYYETSLKRKSMDEITAMVFGGRYMLLFMGFFAMYMGAIYNEFFCIPIDLFGTVWKACLDPKSAECQTTGAHFGKEECLCDTQTARGSGFYIPGVYGDTVYSFGFDPRWIVAENVLASANSFKMKMAVILGVSQMTLGIFCKTSNAIHFKDKLALIFECIPQILFMLCLFGYMDFLIILKWMTNWEIAQCCEITEEMLQYSDDPQKHLFLGKCANSSFKNPSDPSSNIQVMSCPTDKMTVAPYSPPSLITTMINMPLAMGSTGDEPLLYPGQVGIQQLLLAIAVLAVPTMLFPKPILENKMHQEAHLAHHHLSEDEGKNDADGPPGPSGEGEEEHSLSDLMIHQAIETIEFVLGCVSNTASYLRLWALSLAHAELSKTFWQMTIALIINSTAGSPVAFLMLVPAYGGFAIATFLVLMLMDLLECYLHALRLHWVEFQNKFYKADGYAFIPFTFKDIDVEDITR
eukprot:g4077.t1